MKRFFLAVVLTVAGAVFIFILSKVLLFHPDFKDSIYENGVPRALAGFFFIAFPFIHQWIAGKRRSNFSHLPDEAVPLEAYTLPWYILFVYGVLITFAFAGMSLFLIWLVGIATGFFITRAVSISNLIFLLITFYYLGFWIGSRSARRPYLTAVGIVLSYTILELLMSLVLNIDSLLRSSLGLAIFLSLSFFCALIGTLIGKRRRLLSYVGFLFGSMPEQERQTLVDNLYWEIKRIKGIQKNNE